VVKLLPWRVSELEVAAPRLSPKQIAFLL